MVSHHDPTTNPSHHAILGPFALFEAFTFVGTVWVFFAFPECKGRSMEGTDELFSLPWWMIGFARVPEGGGVVVLWVRRLRVRMS